jgi:hypothetical protein
MKWRTSIVSTQQSNIYQLALDDWRFTCWARDDFAIGPLPTSRPVSGTYTSVSASHADTRKQRRSLVMTVNY